MPALTEERRVKLLGIIAQENSKTGTCKTTPAVFRETWQDTHKTMPPEYFGPPIIVDHRGQRTFSSRSASQLGTTCRPRRSGSNNPPSAPPVEFRSVFKPHPDQEYVCGLAKTRRNNVACSEWALLDTLETQMFVDEREQCHRQQASTQRFTRTTLDQQMLEKERARQQEEYEKTLERQIVLSQVEQHKEEEQRKAEAQRQHHQHMKKEREMMLEAAKEQKRKSCLAKQAEEQAQLQQAQQQLEEEQRRAAAKQAALKKQWLDTRAANDARIQQRKEADAFQRQLDEQLMQETIKILERQELDREQAAKAFQEMVAARANRAGQKAVEENRERAEREARLIKQFEEQKEREYAEREQRDRMKKELQKEQLQRARQEALAQKQARTDAAKAEQQWLKQEADRKAQMEREAEDLKKRTLRERAANNQQFLQTQMLGKESRTLMDDVGMTDNEQRLNLRLLQHAAKTIGEPKQMTVRLY